jgi:transposase
LAEPIKRWVIQGPTQLGLHWANWTHEKLAQHLRKTQGIRTSRSAVQRFCSRIGIRLYRPSYRYLRADPAKQTTARQQLAELKKKGRRR